MRLKPNLSALYRLKYKLISLEQKDAELVCVHVWFLSEMSKVL